MCDLQGYGTLEKYFEIGLLDEVFSCIHEWPKSEWKNIEDVKEVIQSMTADISDYLRRQNTTKMTDAAIHHNLLQTIDSRILYLLNMEIAPVIYEENKTEDVRFFERCKNLNALSVAPYFSGATLQLSAAVVELANLDSCSYPGTKIDCLVSCFDLIYAELKMAMAETIADSDEAENQIPILDGADVLPILVWVIAKTRPKHFFSNMSYIRAFGSENLLENTPKYIFEMFEAASRKMLGLKTSGGMLKAVELSVHKELNQGDLNELMMQIVEKRAANAVDTDKRMSRVTRQIFTSLETSFIRL